VLLIVLRRYRASRFPQSELERVMASPAGEAFDVLFWSGAAMIAILPTDGVVAWWAISHGQAVTGVVLAAAGAGMPAYYAIFRRRWNRAGKAGGLALVPPPGRGSGVD
jgi:hypothetical protein